MTTDSIPAKVGHDRLDVAAGLRTLAEFLEAFPELPAPNSVRAQMSIIEGDEVTRIREAVWLAGRLGVDLVPNDYGVRAELRIVGNVSLVVFAMTDEGRARHLAESSYSGAVQP